MVEREAFRKDLYYRLNVFPIYVPPLRDRRDDIPLLTEHFLMRVKATMPGKITGISPSVMDLFMQLYWPGNVRELKHAIEFSAITCPGGTIQTEHLPQDLIKEKSEPATTRDHDFVSIAEIDKINILEALRRNKLNITKTALDLGVSRSTLWRKMQRYRIQR
jgi:transcriptional regulator with PAS, ATPase and Fis domain